MNQLKKPLYEALISHLNKHPISYHVPGHKYGQVFPEEGNTYFQEILKIDATELSGLDDLHSPDGPILEAEALLANLYKAKKSFFLINGSTVGNLTMVLAACKENSLVLVQRNCHKSILNALKLAKANPIFLAPEFDPDWKIATGVSIETVQEAVKTYPNAKALIVTYPNYYGITYDLKAMIAIAHEYDIPVLVDEAHGAHFILGDPFPSSAVQLGADLVVQSAHKTLPAMTMGSFLHLNSNFIDEEQVIDYLHTFQSSSPSYPIMSSLDLARGYLAAYNQADLQYLLKEIQLFKEELGQISGIRVLASEPLKLTIQSTCGHSGFYLQKKLEQQGIYTELADPYNILLVLPLLKSGQTYPFKETTDKIKIALKGVKATPMKEIIPSAPANRRISRLMAGYKEMETLRSTVVPSAKALGKAAAETIVPYPPGIPLLLQGEKITADKLESLMRLLQDGANFQGGSFLKENKIKVYAD